MSSQLCRSTSCRPRLPIAAVVLLLTIVLPAHPAHAATLDVCPTGGNFTTIQAAINAASAGDTIKLCDARFVENIVIDKDLTLLGVDNYSTIIDGDERGSTVTVLPGATVQISHANITRGRVEPSEIVGWGSGGGVHNEGRLTLDDVNVNSSVAYMGGGIGNERGELTLRNSIVIDNRAEMGAGVANIGSWEGMATMFVRRTYIVDNFATVDLYEGTHDDAGAGGGLYNNDFSILHVELSDIDSNAAERFGGGIQNSEGWGSAAQLWVSDTVIRGNSAYAGGGINTNATVDLVNDNIWGNQARGASPDQADGQGGGIRNTGTLHITNSTINGNYASGFEGGAPGGQGGGIYTYNWSDAQNPSPDVVVLTNVTLAENSADRQGGGLYVEQGSPQLQNSIIARNRQGDNCAGAAPASLGYNLADDTSCNLNGTGDQPGVDPLLGEWTGNGGPTNTYALLRGSPAIDVVAARACTVATDQRGVSRPQGPRCDSGAFELEQGQRAGLLLSYGKSGKVGGINFADEDILFFEFATGRWYELFDGSDVGLSQSDIDAFELLADGSLLLSFNQDTRVPGLDKVKGQDIIKFVPTQLGTTTAGYFAWYLRGAEMGFPQKGQGMDAIAFAPDGRLVISPRNRVKLPGTSGEDEDLLVWNAGGGSKTAAWAVYLDGSQIGLGDSSQEDIKAASIDPQNGAIYMATAGAFSANGVRGNGQQVLVCTPNAPGSRMPCNLALFWDGAALGPAKMSIDGLSLVAAAPSLSAADTVNASAAEDDTGDDVYDLDEDEGANAEQNYRVFLPAVLQETEN